MEKISEKELESIMGLLFDINGHNRMNNPHLDIIFKAGFEAGMKHVNNGVLDDVSDTLIAWEQFKKANWYESEAIDVEKMLMDKFQAIYGR